MSKHLSGDFISKMNTTKHWVTVKVSLYDLDVHYDQIIEMADASAGYYTEMSDDREAVMKFQFGDDARSFEERYMGVS